MQDCGLEHDERLCEGLLYLDLNAVTLILGNSWHGKQVRRPDEKVAME
jgi:hypothetical protein